MSKEAIKIKQGQYSKAKSIEENANGDVQITAPDGTIFDLVPKQQCRQTFSKDLLQVAVYDAVLDNYFWAVTNELKDAVTSEVDSTGTVTLAGASGSVDGITVDGVEIMSGPVTFITDLATTAEAVVDNINAGPEKLNYLASSVGAIITITALAYNKTDANGFVVVATTTTLTTTDVNMAGGITAIVSDVDPQTDYDAVKAYLSTFIGKI